MWYNNPRYVLTFANGTVGSVNSRGFIALTNVNGLTTKPWHMPKAAHYLALNKPVQVDVPVTDFSQPAFADRITFECVWATEERIKRLGLTIVEDVLNDDESPEDWPVAKEPTMDNLVDHFQRAA